MLRRRGTIALRDLRTPPGNCRADLRGLLPPSDGTLCSGQQARRLANDPDGHLRQSLTQVLGRIEGCLDDPMRLSVPLTCAVCLRD